MSKLTEEVALIQTKRAQTQDTVIAVSVVVIAVLVLTGLAAWLFLKQSVDVDLNQAVDQSSSLSHESERPSLISSREENRPIEGGKQAPINEPALSEPALASNSEHKIDFENELTRYNDEFKPSIETLKNLRWSSGDAQSIAQLEQEAVNEYADQNYLEAYTMMGDVIRRATDLLGQQRDEFASLNEAHSEALFQGQVAETKRLLTAIKQVAPNHANITKLEQYTQNLPQALEQQRTFRNLLSQKQYHSALETVAMLQSLQPYNSEWGEQETKLKATIKENVIEAAKAEINGLINNEQFSQARKVLSQSQSIGIPSAQLSSFKNKIENGLRTQAVRRLLDTANNAESKDNWVSAVRHYREALVLDSENSSVAKKLQLAEAIVSSSEGLQTLIDKPFTLSDQDVGNYADSQIRKARELQVKSPSLKSNTDKLSEMLDLARVKRAVQVVSDGKTRIEVQTIGFIEPTTEKVIQLYPGKYLLFARCKKSKDTVVELLVPLRGQVPISRVECGERI